MNQNRHIKRNIYYTDLVDQCAMLLLLLLLVVVVVLLLLLLYYFYFIIRHKLPLQK